MTRTEHDVAREGDLPLIVGVWVWLAGWGIALAAVVMGLWSRFGGGRSC